MTRVHSKQCHYVLSDAKAMRDKIRGVLAVLKDFSLDPTAGKAKYVNLPALYGLPCLPSRPDQLNLPYDDAFMAQLDLDMDFSALGSASESSRRSSLMSPLSQVSSRSSFMDNDQGDDQGLVEPDGLELPSDPSVGALQRGFDMATGFSGGLSSVGRGGDHSDLAGGDSLIEDAGWEVDEHGEIHETGESALPGPPRDATEPNPFADIDNILAHGTPPVGSAVRGESAGLGASSSVGGLLPLPPQVISFP